MISHGFLACRTLTRTTTMPLTAREEVEITALIRGILNGYPGNSAILREYLQNSDDAKALKQASFTRSLDYQFIHRANRSLSERYSSSMNKHILRKPSWILPWKRVKGRPWSLTMMGFFVPKIGRPFEQSILPAKQRTRSQFLFLFSGQSKEVCRQTGKNGLGFRASYHVWFSDLKNEI